MVRTLIPRCAANADPANGGTIQHCASFSGTATLPSGDSVWLIVKSWSNQRFYPEGLAIITSPNQSGNVTWMLDRLPIGSAGESGSRYDINAVVLNPELSTYLASMTIITSSGNIIPMLDTGGSAYSLPPDLLAKAVVVETRDSSRDNCR